MKLPKLFIAVLILSLSVSVTSFAKGSLEKMSNRMTNGRFFYEGNGSIKLARAKSGATISVTYRNPDGTYNQQALNEINNLFGMPASALGEGVSLRLISMLDFLQDKFAPNKFISITSGYRSPNYNAALKRKGGTVAETSYHMEGMAADITIPGVEGKKLWNYVRSLDCCGIGHYGSNVVHIDSGRPRFWEKATALSAKNVNPENRNIYLEAENDIYYPGETVRFFFSGISNYPFGVNEDVDFMKKIRDKNIYLQFNRGTHPQDENKCVMMKDRKDSRFMYWNIPSNWAGSKKKSEVQITFCNHKFEKMPHMVVSRPFVIKSGLSKNRTK